MVNIKEIADKYRQEIYDDLEQLVHINSFSNNIPGLYAMSDKLVEIAARHGIKLERTIVAEDKEHRPHLMYRNDAHDGYYAFLGHFDTVHPPESSFNKLIKNDDTWVGPGVNDMKNGLLIALYSVVILKELMPLEEIPLRILFNADEEIGSPMSQHLISTELKDAKGGFVFEGGRVGDQIFTSRKGGVVLDIDVIGRASHAAQTPQTGINAVADAAKVIGKLMALNNKISGNTLQCTLVSGGTLRNVIPDHCQIGVDIRVTDPESWEQLRGEIEQALTAPDLYESRIEYKITVKRPPYVRTEQSGELISKYLKAAAELGFDIGEASSGGLSDACNLSSLGVPVIDGIGAVGQFPHTDKEYVETQSVFDRLVVFSHFFYQLINEESLSPGSSEVTG